MLIEVGKYRRLFLRFCKEYKILHLISSKFLYLNRFDGLRFFSQFDLLRMALRDNENLSQIDYDTLIQLWNRFFYYNAFQQDIIEFINICTNFLNRRDRKFLYPKLKKLSNNICGTYEIHVMIEEFFKYCKKEKQFMKYHHFFTLFDRMKKCNFSKIHLNN